MSSIITAAFNATFGLLVNKARDKAAEKLKEGDVTDKRIRDLIQREIDNIKSKLDGLARKDLLAAIDAFEAGVKYLYQAVDADAVAAMAGAGERGNEASSIPIVNTVALATEMGKMELTELNEKTKSALSEAKERFKMAREEATRAFNNEALSSLDRIKAIRYRVMATMLESATAVATAGIAGDSSLSVKGALENALPECEQCLQKLNSLPDVQNSLKVELDKGLLNIRGRFGKDQRREIISTVSQVNRAIYDAAQASGKYGLVLNWPSVDTGEDTIDPLHDDRVAKVLRKVDMKDCFVPWSFGQEGEEEHKLKDPMGIATNANGQFIIADDSDKRVKVFGSTGKFVLQFHPERNDTETDFAVRDVATDVNSNIYVLVCLRRAGAEVEVQVFSPTADLLYKFPVRGGRWNDRLAVTNNKVLVRRGRTVVDVYKHEGTYVCSFGEGMLKDAWDITAGPDGQVMILDRGNSCVFIFTDDGQQQCKFNINTKEDDLYRRIACHPSGEHVVVAGWEQGTDHLSVVIYTKDGEFVRRIKLHEDEFHCVTGISVSMEGHIAVTVTVSKKGKVIVL